VKLILLDVRYNKQNDDILGEIQWKWLEKQLWDNDAVVTIFASGLLIKNVEDFNVYFQRNANHA
jgi:phosphodiesterase/alkaline phosphatase D-like protein